jgi:hypothetical protein
MIRIGKITKEMIKIGIETIVIDMIEIEMIEIEMIEIEEVNLGGEVEIDIYV